MEEIEQLSVFSKVKINDNGQPYPYVLEAYQEMSQAEYTPDQARTRAAELFRAAAIAQCLAGAAQNLFRANAPKKGFSSEADKKNTAATRKVQEILQLLVSGTSPFEKGIEIRLKFKLENNYATTRVRLTWESGQELDLEPSECQSHAKNLFAAAESVQTDMYLAKFLDEKEGFSFMEQQILLQDFLTFRQQAWLENLLDE